MTLHFPSRLWNGVAVAALLCAGPLFARQPAAAQPKIMAAPRPGAGARQPAVKAPQKKEEHLAQWMENHRNLPLQDQLRALDNEPGFRDLPAQTQQRDRDRLVQLNNMTPQQRGQLLERNELIEHLTVPQRQQFRGAMQQYGALPPERRRLVAHAFKDLRAMPPGERQAVIDSPRIRSEFSDNERSTLQNLLAVEPYLPVHGPAE